MRHSVPVAPQFYVTSPQPCPYLAGRMERKLFTALQDESSLVLNDALSRQGFRRSQNVLYRPTCVGCSACLSSRIRVADFKPSRSQRRVAKRNAYLERSGANPWATEDQYALFRSYLAARHAEGGMADMDAYEFAAMVEETPVRTRIVEYYTPEDPLGRRRELSAVALTDVLEDGLSMVYSFFDPALSGNSVGTHIILDHVEIAREAGLPYVYLGYWVPGSAKMDYKARFDALEIFYKGKWQALEDPDNFLLEEHPLNTKPIAEQVTAIDLPNLKS